MGATAATSRSRTGREADVTAFLVDAGLVGADVPTQLTALTGGVSSDIWLVTAGAYRVVVKQPLADLKVSGGWQAPLARSGSEEAWLRTVHGLLPGACPQVLAFDARRSMLALDYLDPAAYAVWKSDLLDGLVVPDVAAAVGDRLGAIHRLTAARPELAADFATDDLFHALRLEPYLQRVAARHPSLSGAVTELIDTTSSTRFALVHGDVSPKNILVGPSGPVLLDAECAWWGDPAFDLAFCLNHLMLKCLVPSVSTPALVASFGELVDAYMAHVEWEPPAAVTVRAARLLPALMLARIDGRSPVEYLGTEQQAVVRSFSTTLLTEPTDSLTAVINLWKEALT